MSCGEPSGYRAHYRRGEKPCEPCRIACNEHRRKRRALKNLRKKQYQSMLDECGTFAGYQKHGREGTPTCFQCRRAAADYHKLRRSTETKSVLVPVMLLAEMYLCAPLRVQELVDEHIGMDRMSVFVERFDIEGAS